MAWWPVAWWHDSSAIHGWRHTCDVRSVYVYGEECGEECGVVWCGGEGRGEVRRYEYWRRPGPPTAGAESARPLTHRHPHCLSLAYTEILTCSLCQEFSYNHLFLKCPGHPKGHPLTTSMINVIKEWVHKHAHSITPHVHILSFFYQSGFVRTFPNQRCMCCSSSESSIAAVPAAQSEMRFRRCIILRSRQCRASL